VEQANNNPVSEPTLIVVSLLAVDGLEASISRVAKLKEQANVFKYT